MKYWIYGLGASTFILATLLGLWSYLGLAHFERLQNLQTQGEQMKSIILEQKNDLLAENRVLRDRLDLTEEELDEIEDELRDEKHKFDNLSDEVSDALGTVGVLQRLQELDEELLIKYSNVLFLNENYVPSDLTAIDSDYNFLDGRDYLIHGDVEPFLDELLEDAEDDGIDLRIISAYRSFETQEAIKTSYVITYGQTAANQFSADQGFSEHQLGTTVDFTTPEIGSQLSQFKNTEAYQWLVDRAYRYGFILSYPEGNGYFIPEAWHWRFVGKDLARHLHREEINFYDMDQREINEYLIDIFED